MNTSSQKYLKIIRWGIFLCAFTPLFFYGQFLSIFQFPKLIVFRSIVEIILIFYILLIIGNKKYRPNWKNPILIAITVFTGLYVITSITGANFYKSFWGTIERMGGMFNLIHYWVFFVILTSVFGNSSNQGVSNANKYANDWMKLLRFCVLAGFFAILFGFGQKFHLSDFFVGWQHESRIISIAGNAALYAGYLIFVIFLGLYLFIKDNIGKVNKNRLSCWQVFYGLVIVLGMISLFMTVVRGSILSFAGSVFLLGIFSILVSKKKKVRRVSVTVLVVLLILISVLWACRGQSWVQNDRYLNRITDISLETRTIQTRFSAWSTAWQGWKERFILGWGPENFNLIFAKHFNPVHYAGSGSELVWDRAHNTLLNTGATMGIIGLLSYLSIFVVLFLCLLKSFKRERSDTAKHRNSASNANDKRRISLVILSVMFIAYIGHNMFIFDSFNTYLLFFITLGYVSCFSKQSFYLKTGKNKSEQGINFEKVRKLQKVATFILVPVVAVTIWKTAVIPAKASFVTTRAIVYKRLGEYRPSFDYYKKAFSYNFIQGTYKTRHLLAKLVFKVFSKTDNPQELGVEKEDLIFALNEVYKNIEKHPQDYIPCLYAARLNEFISRVEQKQNIEKARQRLEEAERLLNKAKTLSEKNPYIYFELGQVHIFKAEFEKAIEFFDKGILLKPNIKLGYWYKGITLLDMGKIEEGEEFIKKAEERGYKKSVGNIQRIIKIYVSLKDYPKIIELYKQAIELQPDNAQFYASLATAYKENGQIDKAIEVASKIGDIDPEMKAEAEAWINMLKVEYK